MQTAAANGGVPPTEKLDASPAPGIAGDGTGCQSTTAQTVSTEWCINNCAMGNCPMTMCSEDCLRPTEAEIAWAKGENSLKQTAKKVTTSLRPYPYPEPYP